MNITRYIVLGKSTNKEYAAFLDLDDAEDILSLANGGFRTNQGWMEESFYIEKRISKIFRDESVHGWWSWDVDVDTLEF